MLTHHASSPPASLPNPLVSSLQSSNLQSPASSPRRRGGQPGNSNARVHGFYAARPAGAPDPERVDLFRYAPPKIPLRCWVRSPLLMPACSATSST